uniref:Uncharacterized protein n=1 Tax=Alexandrium catenella TaxID=2925 RepID=A0A7S1MES9_ALECA|mmetsp:Transcript_23934/g.65224  ORF Transcript_23934/g.65224 Transcript_23934/m.65224 type:complete len:140 (+) Transcript_23934:44-463(+)
MLSRGKFVTYLRVWLLFLAAIELPAIWEQLSPGSDGLPFKGVNSNLHAGRAQRRLWALVLGCLVAARVAAAAAPTHSIVLAHNASVHCLEALYVGAEFLSGADDSGFITAIVMANAALFAGAAVWLPAGSPADKAGHRS